MEEEEEKDEVEGEEDAEEEGVMESEDKDDDDGGVEDQSPELIVDLTNDKPKADEGRESVSFSERQSRLPHFQRMEKLKQEEGE